MKGQIDAATSLDELLRRYDPVRKQVDSAKKEASEAGKERPSNDEIEPYKSEKMLREAINQWEERAKEIHAIRFYWLVGLVLSVLGLLTYSKLNRWLGVSLLIAGFSELIYWTSPTFLGSTQEFDRLLANKLALSAFSLILLFAVTWLLEIFAEKGEDSSQPRHS